MTAAAAYNGYRQLNSEKGVHSPYDKKIYAAKHMLDFLLVDLLVANGCDSALQKLNRQSPRKSIALQRFLLMVRPHDCTLEDPGVPLRAGCFSDDRSSYASMAMADPARSGHVSALRQVPTADWRKPRTAWLGTVGAQRCRNRGAGPGPGLSGRAADV